MKLDDNEFVKEVVNRMYMKRQRVYDVYSLYVLCSDDCIVYNGKTTFMLIQLRGVTPSS